MSNQQPDHVRSREALTPSFDAHVHIWEHPWQNFVVGTARPGRYSQRDLLLALMDRHGVRKACVIGACDDLNPRNNEFVAELCQDNPDRFVMLAEVTLPGGARNELLLKTLEAWPALGFRCTDLPGDTPDDWAGPRYSEFWGRVNEAGLIVALNVSPRQTAQLQRLVERHSEIRWLLDHMGRPRFDMSEADYHAVLDLARFSNVFVKVSGFYAFTRRSSEYPYLDLTRFVRGLRDAFGSRRLLWGSDAPPVLDFSSYEQSFACLLREEMALTDEDLTWIFGNSAQQFFLSRSQQRPAASLQIA